MLETAAMIVELNKAFDIANNTWWDGKLPTPMIIVSRKSSKWELGYITVQKVWTEKDAEEGLEETHDPQKRYEINISAEGLGRSIEEILATLVHEMVHEFHLENGIKDTSQKIHNKNFKREAERVGLIVERSQGVGYGHTMPSPEFIEIVNTWGIDETPFKFVRGEVLKPVATKKKKKGRRWIYTDPNDPDKTFNCKFDIEVIDVNTGEAWNKDLEEEDDDED